MAIISLSAPPISEQLPPAPSRPHRRCKGANPTQESAFSASSLPPPASPNAVAIVQAPNNEPLSLVPSTRARTLAESVELAQIQSTLEGLGPVIPGCDTSQSDHEDDEFGTLFPRIGRGGRPAAKGWSHFYALGPSKKPPATYTVAVIKPLSRKPKPPDMFVGCCYCNVPDEQGQADMTKWTAYGINSGTVSNIVRHIKSAHPELLESLSSNNTDMEPQAYTTHGFLDALVKWIIADDQSLSVVESTWFRSLVRALNPTIPKSDIPHRTWIHDQVLRFYREDRVVLRKLLQDSKGRISIASDLWSDQNLRSFMAVTLHWIAENASGELELKVALGGFRHLEASHTGENIAEKLLEVLDDLRIADKIGGITLDNASNNKTATASLAELLDDREIPFDHNQQRLGCFAHVINLAVQAALKMLPYPLEFQPSDVEDLELRRRLKQLTRDEEYLEDLEKDLVKQVSDWVAEFRASGNRRHEFQKAIEECNKIRAQLSPDKDPIPAVQFLRQMPVRWSSTYWMLDRWLELTPAINHFFDHENSLNKDRDDIFTRRQTFILDEIRTLLSWFHLTQETLSGEKNPTLSFVLPLYTELVGELKDFCLEIPELAHATYEAIQKIEGYLADAQSCHLTVLAMVLHPGVKLHWVQGIWSAEEIERAKMTTLAAMSMHSSVDIISGTTATVNRPEKRLGRQMRALQEKRRTVNANSRQTRSRIPINQPEPLSIVYDEEELTLEERESLAQESELDAYMREPCQPYSTAGTHNALLGYWQSKQAVYPRLFKLAMTVLAAPATTVPVERIFSSSADTDTSERSRLSPIMLEALQVLKFNYRNGISQFAQQFQGYTHDKSELESVLFEEMKYEEVREAFREAFGD